MSQFEPSHFAGHQDPGSEIALPSSSGWTIGERHAEYRDEFYSLWIGDQCTEERITGPATMWQAMDQWLSEGVQRVEWEWVFDKEHPFELAGVSWTAPNEFDIGTGDDDTDWELSEVARRLVGRDPLNEAGFSLLECWRVAEVLSGQALEPVIIDMAK